MKMIFEYFGSNKPSCSPYSAKLVTDQPGDSFDHQDLKFLKRLEAYGLIKQSTDPRIMLCPSEEAVRIVFSEMYYYRRAKFCSKDSSFPINSCVVPFPRKKREPYIYKNDSDRFFEYGFIPVYSARYLRKFHVMEEYNLFLKSLPFIHRHFIKLGFRFLGFENLISNSNTPLLTLIDLIQKFAKNSWFYKFFKLELDAFCTRICDLSVELDTRFGASMLAEKHQLTPKISFDIGKDLSAMSFPDGSLYDPMEEIRYVQEFNKTSAEMFLYVHGQGYFANQVYPLTQDDCNKSAVRACLDETDPDMDLPTKEEARRIVKEVQEMRDSVAKNFSIL